MKLVSKSANLFHFGSLYARNHNEVKAKKAPTDPAHRVDGG
jgi:hypothetical protein